MFGIAVTGRGSDRAGRHLPTAQQEGGLVEAYVLNEMQRRHADDGGCRPLQCPFTNAKIASSVRDPERSRQSLPDPPFEFRHRRTALASSAGMYMRRQLRAVGVRGRDHPE